MKWISKASTPYRKTLYRPCHALNADASYQYLRDTHRLSELIDERKHALDALEVAETKYISSFQLSSRNQSDEDPETERQVRRRGGHQRRHSSEYSVSSVSRESLKSIWSVSCQSTQSLSSLASLSSENPSSFSQSGIGATATATSFTGPSTFTTVTTIPIALSLSSTTILTSTTSLITATAIGAASSVGTPTTSSTSLNDPGATQAMATQAASVQGVVCAGTGIDDTAEGVVATVVITAVIGLIIWVRFLWFTRARRSRCSHGELAFLCS